MKPYTIVRHTVAAVIAAAVTVRTHHFRVLSVRGVQYGLLAVFAIVAGVFIPTKELGAMIFAVGAVTHDDIASMVSTEVIETFKEVYLDALDAIPDSTPLTAQLHKGAKVSGAADELIFNVKLLNGGGVANVGDAQALPTPTRPIRKKGRAGLAHTYTTIAVGGQSVPLTKSNRNAFVSNLEEQLSDGMERVRFDIERQYNGDGRGVLATLETVVGAPTWGAQKPFGRTYTQAGVPGTMLLNEGARVAFVNPANGAERGRTTIATVDHDTDEFTTSSSPAGAAIGDLIVLVNDVAATGDDAATNYLNEASGIGAVIGTEEFEGIAGTFRRWQAVDQNAAGAAITEKMVATLNQRIIARSGQKPKMYYTSRGIVLGFQDTLSAKRQYNGETLKLKGGYEGLDLNGMPVLAGDWCPKGDFYALNTEKKNVAMVDVVKMGYVDLDGSKLHRIEGRHAWRADLWFPHNAIWYLRAAQGRISNGADDLTILR